MLDIRVSEVKAIIDELYKKDFLIKMFGENAQNGSFDFDNLIVSGHSMGGSTAMVAGDQDNRIKTVLTHDIWYQIFQERLPNFKNLFSKRVQTITSAQYAVENHFDDPFGTKLRDKFKTKELFESLIVERTHHLQQTDCSIM